ncbi:type III-B CRISPR module RAMP protein Cmr1 [Marinobacterium stanieri]|uniref:type III-B CRISPR module RAMP protein Cmr1 n=1 Tax=Marinobacterium stanieri TaxID=49186 RepID=UPI003A92B64A
MDMEIIKADFVITTPMFLGEAENQVAENVRPPAVKGALRFWWRALQWPLIRSGRTSDEEALRELHHQESGLFGHAAEEGKNYGQAKFLLRITSPNLPSYRDSEVSNSQELQYLLGQGLCTRKGELLREHLVAGKSFNLQLALKSDVTTEQKQQLVDALLCFGLLGNLGSRARKGFGSVSLQTLTVSGEDYPLPQGRADFSECVKRLIGTVQETGLPPFSAFSRETRLQIAAAGSESLELLKLHGREMGMYRGYGNNGRTFNQAAEQNFQDDHDWAYAVSDGKRQTNLPKRAVFGLPHPYFLSSIKKNVSVDVEGGQGRRASPLFAHVHQLPDKSYLLVHLVLGSVFLPGGATVNVKAKEGARFELEGGRVDEQIDWSVLDNFLQRFPNREVIDV